MENILIIGKGTMGRGVYRVLQKSNFSPSIISLRFGTQPTLETLNLIQKSSLIIECVSEDLEKKSFVLSFCSENNSEAFITSCTSSLSISELQRHVTKPERFLGMHFMNPAQLISVVEVVPGLNTSSSAVERISSFLTQIDRQAVVVPDLPGFALNAILFAMLNRAAYFIESSGMSPVDVDDLMIKVCGHRLGPLATLDLIGLDVSLIILENLHVMLPKFNLAPAPILSELVGKGFLGKKTKQGFFPY